MTGKAEKGRPFFVAIGLLAAIGAALVAPVMIGARRGEPIPGSTVRASTRDSVAISTPMSLFSSPSIVLERGTVALVSPETAETRVGALIRALTSGSKTDLVLDDAKLIVDRSANLDAGAPDNAVAAELAPVISALSSFSFRSLAILDSKIVIKTASGAAEAINIKNVEISPGSGAVVNAKGRIEIRGEPLDIDTAFVRPHPERPAAPVQVRAAIKGNLMSASFNGRLASGEHGAQITADNADVSIVDLRKFASWLGTSWPSGTGLGAFTAKGALTLEERAISFEQAEFSLDGNAATGALMLKLGGERPAIEGTLAFATFDVAPYLMPSRPYALAIVTDWLSGFRLPGLSSTPALGDLDADIRLSAANVTSGTDRLGRCAASLSIGGGKLFGEVAELEFEQGGRGEGQFTVDTTAFEPRYTLRAELDDVDLETVLASRLGPAALDGAGDVKIDVNTKGASQTEMLKSLNGALSVEMSDGGRVGFDLDALAAAANATDTALAWSKVAGGSTTVSSLLARFEADNGTLKAKSVEASTDDRSIAASGTVDVDKSTLDLVLSIVPAPGAGSADAAGKALGAFKINGPWADPAVTRAGPGKAAGAVFTLTDPG